MSRSEAANNEEPRRPDRESTTSSIFGESMTGVFSNLLGRRVSGGNSGETLRSAATRSPIAARSPSGSKVSSRRESFMFFMGMSTDSALSDGNEETASQPNNFKSASFRRKFSEKSLVKPVSNSTPQFTSLHEEYNRVTVEYSRLKQLIEQVRDEYEDTKEFDVIKRYAKLKGVIKRCLTYMRLGILPDAPGTAAGLCNIVDIAVPSSITQRYSFTGVVSDIPKAELIDKTETIKRRISLLRSQIQIMSENYELSKQYMVFQRYRLMKAMIKELVTDGSRY